ncbi:MAG: DEAD/DEAH box helicase [Spirochaetaceae bacterium]|nr:MAG: DEAD/DEAH box helicase [Spirochaetaceae bacterium]
MVEELLRDLRSDSSFMEHVRHWKTVDSWPGEYGEIPRFIDSRLLDALQRQGIDRLYSHQLEAIRHVTEGRNVVVVTPTASGKTLTYNVPVLDRILREPDSRALYLFPTKALTQDQQAELNDTIEKGSLPVAVMTYDGDTPRSIRSSVRTRGRIVVTNPDMLHTGVLPNHTRWAQFFQNLRYVVIDELHVYRGIFGSHVTNVIRRLTRVARFYGADPQFILCSATIGNPRELAERVVGVPVELVEKNGAPRGEKHLILYNPPLVDRVQGIRQGVVHASVKLALRFLRRGVKTIVFSRSRQRTELVADYIRKDLENIFTENERIRVESYRGGYLPSERRSIEKGLREGTIQGVVSTNALELGIDIGGLDAAVLGGFPGSVAAALQQAGRAGRRRSVSIAVLVASSSPVDQYVVEHPDFFLERSPESAWVNPDNPYVLMDQLKCAVFDLPMDRSEHFAPGVEDLLRLLEENGVVHRTGDRWHWSDQSYPAESVSLRSATSDNVVIVDTTDGADQVIGEMDRPSAKEFLFDNAIYIHRGTQYVVRKLDIDNRQCRVELSEVNYFTDALVKVDVQVLTEDEEVPAVGGALLLGDVLVRSVVAKFKKIRFSTHENVGYGDIDLPEEQMHTRAVMTVFPPGHPARKALDALSPAARPVALNRLARLVRNVAPVFLMSVPQDLGVYSAVRDPHFGEPAFFLYDRYPGGSGLAEAFAAALPAIMTAARHRVTGCGCSSGCPSCVGPVDAAEGWEGNPREAVRTVLEGWLEGRFEDANWSGEVPQR